MAQVLQGLERPGGLKPNITELLQRTSGAIGSGRADLSVHIGTARTSRDIAGINGDEEAIEGKGQAFSGKPRTAQVENHFIAVEGHCAADHPIREAIKIFTVIVVLANVEANGQRRPVVTDDVVYLNGRGAFFVASDGSGDGVD